MSVGVEICKKITEEPATSMDAAAAAAAAAAAQGVKLVTDDDESVFSASTLKAATAASIIMNIRVSWSLCTVVICFAAYVVRICISCASLHTCFM